MNLEIFARRRRRIFLAPGASTLNSVEALPPQYTGAVLKNIEALGWTFSTELVERIQTLSLKELTVWYEELVPALRALVGAHREWKPLYPNFPSQVMEMPEARLYLNAILHYLTNRLPHFEKTVRLPLFDNVELKILELGSPEEFDEIFTSLASAKGSLSVADKTDLAWFVGSYGDGIYQLLPEEIPARETVAILGTLLLKGTTRGAEFLEAHIKTATDVLRVAVALCEGDVSLATPTKFKNISRAHRRLLLHLLESTPNTLEDMMRWPGRWLRLGERLHPGEFQNKFPSAFAAFRVLRGDAQPQTFNHHLEAALEKRDATAVLELLQTRPGDFARRLDHLLRLDEGQNSAVLEKFGQVAPRVSTPVLLQMLKHFQQRNLPNTLRTFFPKGNVAKVQTVESALPVLSGETVSICVALIESTLRARFAELEPLDKCYLDARLQKFPIPFANRSASKTLRTLPRGSRLPLPDCHVLRFFIWWKNGRARTDIDLSAVLFKEDFNYLDLISYYNLKNYGGHHSGDIVDAPNGAAEFIDINIERTREMGARYIMMSVNSYTDQPFCDLPECFAGWMARTHANSGEIFEPKTLQDRVDLSADTRIALPLIIDLEKREVLWADIALRRYPSFNNVHNNLPGASLMLRAMLTLNKPTLHDLFALHIAARGELVLQREQAEQIFAFDAGVTPFDGERIVANWM